MRLSGGKDDILWLVSSLNIQLIILVSILGTFHKGDSLADFDRLNAKYCRVV